MAFSVGEIEAVLKLRDEMSGKLKEANATLEKFGKTSKGIEGKLKSFGASARKAGIALSVGLTAPLVALAAVSLKSAISFETSFTGVRKTVEATEEEFQKLSQGFRDMAKEIPINVNELNRIGEAAGQLGIETKNIASFTRTMADLGVTTNMASDDAATALARFANITGMSQTEFDRLGSTIVDLGNNFATTEGEIVEMGLRLAGAGAQIGMTEAQILGMAAALSSVGINAEAGGSAMSKVMIEIASSVATGDHNLKLFAAAAKMSTGAFQELFEKDAAGAMSRFVKGLGEIGDEGSEIFDVLKKMGFENIRTRDSLLRSAGASENFAKSLDLASDAWSENIALTKEAETRYATVASQLTILKNNVMDVGIELGTALMPTLIELVEGAKTLTPVIAEWAKSFSDLEPNTKKMVIGALALVAALGPLALAVSVLAGGLVSLIALAGSAAALFTGVAWAAGIIAVAGAFVYLAKVTYDVGEAMAGVNEVSARSIESLGLMKSVTAGADTAMKGLVNTVDEFPSTSPAKALAEMNAGTERLAKTSDIASIATEEVAEALKELSTYALDYKDTLATVNAEDRKMIKTNLEHGASIALIADAYPRLTQAQVESVDKGSKAMKKLADESIKHEENIVAAQIRLMEEVSDGVEERTNKILSGSAVYLDVLRDNTDRAFDLTATDLDRSLEAIRRNEKDKLDEITRTTYTSSGIRALAEQAVRDGSEASVQALRLNNAALVSNSKKSLQETARIAHATWSAMEADPSNYAEHTRNAYRDIAKDAQRTADGVENTWSDAFKRIGDATTGILVDAFTRGGGIVEAAKGMAVLAGAEIGKHISTMVGQLGSMAGPIGAVVGSLAGPLVQAFSGLFSGGALDKVKTLARGYGLLVSEEVADSIMQTMKSERISNIAATVLNATKLFPTIDTGNIRQALRLTHDAFSMIETRQLSVAQAGKVVDEMFGKMAEAGTSATGLISKGLLEIIELNERFGTESAEISKFVTAQTMSAVGGLTTFVNAGAPAIALVGKKSKELTALQVDYAVSVRRGFDEGSNEMEAMRDKMALLTDEILTQNSIIASTQLASQQAATAMGSAITASFLELLNQGMSTTEAIKEIGPLVDGFKQQLVATGFEGSAAFTGLTEMVDLASNEIAGPALEAVEGLNSAMKGLHNAGILDQEMFLGLTGQISSTFKTLVDQGAEGNTALMMMSPSLQAIWELQKDFGYAVDEGTQLLLDQAETAGIVGETHRSIEERVLAVLERIAVVLGAELPAAAREAERQAKAAAENIQNELDSFHIPDININARVNFTHGSVPDNPFDMPGGALGGMVTRTGIQRLAHGGMVRGYAQGTDSVPAMLTPGEAVLTTRAASSLGTAAIGRLNNGGSLSNADVIAELRSMRRQQAAASRQLPVLVAISVRDAMQLKA